MGLRFIGGGDIWFLEAFWEAKRYWTPVRAAPFKLFDLVTSIVM
jgi:hypothetical protein